MYHAEMQMDELLPAFVGAPQGGGSGDDDEGDLSEDDDEGSNADELSLSDTAGDGSDQGC